MVYCNRNSIRLFLLLGLFFKVEVFLMSDAVVSNFYQSVPTLIDNQVYYEYRYSIEDKESGVISERWESRLGDYVKGRYSFLEPTGLIRTVHYEVDGASGYRAIVHVNNPGSSYLSRQQFLAFEKHT